MICFFPANSSIHITDSWTTCPDGCIIFAIVNPKCYKQPFLRLSSRVHTHIVFCKTSFMMAIKNVFIVPIDLAINATFVWVFVGRSNCLESVIPFILSNMFVGVITKTVNIMLPLRLLSQSRSDTQYHKEV